MDKMNPELIGKRFISTRHANKVYWTVIRYHRGGAYVCQEEEHQTTCNFYENEIEEALQVSETIRLARIPSTPEQDLEEMRKMRAKQLKANRPSCKTPEEYLKKAKKLS